MSGWTGADGTALMAVFTGAALGGLLLQPGSPLGPHAPGPVTDLPFAATATDVSIATRGADAVAFHASSFGLGWGLEGDYAGALSRSGDELRLDLAVATVRATHFADDDGPQQLVGIRLALAEDGASGWRTVREGPRVPVVRAVSPGSRLPLEALVLTLPDVGEEELAGRWLVIVHELEIRDTDGTAGLAWSYAHAEPDLLPRLMGRAEDGC